MFFVSITGTTEAIKKLNGIEGEIEKNLNPETISWQYTENGSDILIGSLIENSSIGYCDNESNWPIIQEKLITNMSRVENVLRQMIGKIATKWPQLELSGHKGLELNSIFLFRWK